MNGIYRNVWLTRTSAIHVPTWGTYVPASVQVVNTIIDREGRQIATATRQLQVEALTTGKTVTQIPTKDIRLWSPATPYMYTLQTDILQNGKLTDRYQTKFGIRTCTFDPDKGFFLNGERVQMQGVCCHQDHAGIGVAVPDRLNYWRIAKLKEFGTNAYRSSHNPPTLSVLDACDSLGMPAMDELRVMSSSDEGLSQLRTIIRRDRNHPGWGATAQEWLRYADSRKYIGGAFVWTGFDYGGEALDYFWPGISSNFGILDYCGFPKDAFWYYKAWWTEEPVLHVLPHWNGIGTDSVDVHIYTNLDEVELSLNGKSLGKRTVGKYDIPSWHVKYVPGKLVAKGKKGNRRFTKTVHTTGAAAGLLLTSETGNELRNDSQDIAVLTVSAQDKQGRTVPTANNFVNFEVKNARILGVGNGNPSCHEADVFAPGKPAGRSLFSGYAQLIVAPDGSGNPIEVTASSEGLRPASIVLNVE